MEPDLLTLVPYRNCNLVPPTVIKKLQSLGISTCHLQSTVWVQNIVHGFGVSLQDAGHGFGQETAWPYMAAGADYCYPRAQTNICIVYKTARIVLCGGPPPSQPRYIWPRSAKPRIVMFLIAFIFASLLLRHCFIKMVHLLYELLGLPSYPLNYIIKAGQTNT